MAGARAPKATHPAPEAPDEAPQETPVAPDEGSPVQEAPDTAPQPQEAVTRRLWRADRALGATRRGEQFEADDSDPRVKSGYCSLVGGDEVPEAVAAALADG